MLSLVNGGKFSVQLAQAELLNSDEQEMINWQVQSGVEPRLTLVRIHGYSPPRDDLISSSLRHLKLYSIINLQRPSFRWSILPLYCVTPKNRLPLTVTC